MTRIVLADRVNRCSRRAGIGAGRLRNTDLARPFHGVRVPASMDLDLLAVCSAYAQRMRRCEAFSHRTAAGLPEPAVNVPIHDAAGRQIALGDLVYAEWRVVVEYDGDHHRRDRVQYARDVDRLDDLAQAGWRVIRFNASHVGRRRGERIDRVRVALIAAGWAPSDRRSRR